MSHSVVITGDRKSAVDPQGVAEAANLLLMWGKSGKGRWYQGWLLKDESSLTIWRERRRLFQVKQLCSNAERPQSLVGWGFRPCFRTARALGMGLEEAWGRHRRQEGGRWLNRAQIMKDRIFRVKKLGSFFLKEMSFLRILVKGLEIINF